MISVLIVEDESLTRNFLRDIIPEINPDFVVLDTATNGRNALEKLKSQKTDVLITDIKMPVMDGLALCEHVDSMYPDIQKVILSGYDDFVYAQRSIELNIRGYLLKPIDLQKLRSLLERLQLHIDAMKIRMEKDKLHLESTLWFREQYFQAITLGLNTQLNACVRLLGEQPEIKRYLMILIALDATMDLEEEQDYNVEYLQDLARMNNGIIFSNMSNTLVMILPLEDKEITSHAEYICREMQMNFQGNMYAGIIAGDGNASLPDNYRRAQAVLISSIAHPKTPFMIEKNSAVSSDILSAVSFSDIHYYEHIRVALNNLLVAVLDSDYSAIRREVQHLYHFISEKQTQDAGRLFKELLKTWIPLKETNSILFNERLKVDPFDEEAVTDYLSSINNNAASLYSSNEENLCEQAKAYMMEHYAEPIGLTEVANNLGISANYLSNIFSKVTGVTFIKYLTNIRMEMSIMYLKTKPHMKMSEVAHAVGYPSDKYFLNVFHKYYGVTPSKFRSS